MLQRIKYILLTIVLFLIPTIAFAQEPTPSFDQIINDIVSLMKGAGGMGAVAIILAVVQILMKLSKTFIGDLAGRWKITIVTGLTLAGSILGAIMQGGSIWSALITGGVLSTAQVFVNQLVKQFKKQE